MSSLAITAAAHLVGIPARYAVGRWSNVPLRTILAFNAADTGLNILIRSVMHYVINSRKLELSFYQGIGVCIFCRLVTCLTALYITYKLTDPMPVGYAAMTSLAAFMSISASVGIANYFFPKKP